MGISKVADILLACRSQIAVSFEKGDKSFESGESQEDPGGVRMSQGELGGTSPREEPGGACSQGEPGGARLSPGVPVRSQKEPGGAVRTRRSQ